MKIKEVSEKTSLTERAIRLYIEDGLVAPSVNESYSGRRNVDFSADDVETLKSISVMRKAGFSISEIKLIQTQPEKSKEVLQDFIDRTNKRIEIDTETVTCLMPLLSEEALSFEQIVECLDSPPLMSEKTIPPEDSELSPLQKVVRILFFSLGLIGYTLSLICFVLIFRVEIEDIDHYLYPQYYMNYLIIFIVLCLILPVIIILLNRKKGFYGKKRIRIKTAVSVAMLCLYVYCMVPVSAWSALTVMLAEPESLVVSRTCNTENYMVFDSAAAEKALSEFLPEKIPDIKGIDYKYFYKQYAGTPEPPETEIFLELPLDEEAFSETVEKYRAFRPSDSVCEPEEERKGEWTVIYYRQENEKAPTCYTPVFAFNENENRVRFICEYNKGISFRGSASKEAMIRDYKW